MAGVPVVGDPCPKCNEGKSFGDHLAVKIITKMNQIDAMRRKIKIGKVSRNINNPEFMEELQSSQLLGGCERSVEERVEPITEVPQKIINHHAFPLVRKSLR